MTEPTPTRRPRIHLIESDSPSVRLRLVTGYYAVLASVMTIGLSTLALTAVAMQPARDAFLEHPWRAATTAAVCLSMVQTYRLLRDRRRSGVIAAGIPVALGVANQLVRSAPGGWLSLSGSLLGLILLATIWNELE